MTWNLSVMADGADGDNAARSGRAACGTAIAGEDSAIRKPFFGWFDVGFYRATG